MRNESWKQQIQNSQRNMRWQITMNNEPECVCEITQTASGKTGNSHVGRRKGN
jgi:hypothetical protein